MNLISSICGLLHPTHEESSRTMQIRWKRERRFRVRVQVKRSPKMASARGSPLPG